MGEAKRRGTYEERKEAAIKRNSRAKKKLEENVKRIKAEKEEKEEKENLSEYDSEGI